MPQAYQPTRNGRASICHWDLQFRFHTKEQCERFIAALMAEDIDYNFSYEHEMNDSFNPPVYQVSINDMPWAKNLTTVAKLLENVDYEMD